ncbi:zinc-binding oxidoreductase [Moniliophthora roreri MCA 2997]|uniref:Zinc-binding oxidoreductase n=2 Tax=Moniliophthora roreri TaxID=221103 RepID=V2X462_MONRO|nr:zinc-binding oxidoreductase [Moniliophthora roreri MCA 2997]KAI3610016.1 zinc-binding oxidoreductase [Moniliophthora roreri]
MSLPSQMKAVTTIGDGNVKLTTIPIPKPGSGQILVKVIAAAQNPSEWMKIQGIPTTDVVVGHDYAGVVQEIGPDVPAGTRQIGERVAGFVNACISNDIGGTFAEYTLADAQVLIPLPGHISFEDAATLGLAGFTACQALWQNTPNVPTLDEPTKEPFSILIWGGATSVGQFAIQLAKNAGLQVITTASPKNHELLKSLGADAVFDYRDSAVVDKVIKQVGGKLAYAVDCVSTDDSARQTSECLESGGHVSLVLMPKVEREDIKSDTSFVYTLLGKPINLFPPYQFPAIPEHYDLGKKFGSTMSRLLQQGKLRGNPIKLVPNGLAGAQEWIEFQQAGKVSAEKIVYRIADTA